MTANGGRPGQEEVPVTANLPWGRMVAAFVVGFVVGSLYVMLVYG